MGYLNINSIRNNFSSIPHLIDNNLDIFSVAETKLYSSLAESQFILPGMRQPFRSDVSSRKGGLLVFVNNDIPSQSFHRTEDIQAIFLKINLKQRKLLVDSVYQDKFLSSIGGLHDHYLKSYEDFVIMADFNANESDPAMGTFLNQHKCKI